MRLLLAGAVLGVCLAACGARTVDDPVAALALPTPHNRFDAAYWATLHAKKDHRWRAAVGYCDGRNERKFPNCTAVRVVRYLDTAPEHTVPVFGGDKP
ncbi:MAG TPA: hypothetical protein VGS22_29260 [Thermoanaerobaculia bacterium]|jgi:hypothetical protein|nr:hypothetical protein [Thermoanaerobaculia bacterium]